MRERERHDRWKHSSVTADRGEKPAVAPHTQFPIIPSKQTTTHTFHTATVVITALDSFLQKVTTS